MRRSILLLPVVAVAALTGCVIGPPALTVEDPAPSPDVSTQPGPDDSTQPSAPPTPSQEATAEEPEVTDELG
ncbi:hypothetical protein K6Y82_49275, partial [Burkholderia cenocepacia]